ncbi:hypothetical protein glysoja_047822 [Glycine soja]|uniref:Disease resistance protein At4g27190-like leucine-rich repeats domain-containing protein n=1 Tax=Glycine soja TaxID=3848 RepID=A0A0B2P8X6_GLYSO|nr:hypothetical protein glysoja_047822 [Glycine soja]
MPNLEKLHLWYAEHLLKESSESRLGTVLQLKELVLSLSGIKDIGFEREPVLRRLELLSLFACKKLRNLAPPSVSVAYLTNLNVKYCNGLRNLKASSTAKSLVQLKSMKISGCDELEEIVSNEGNKEEEQIAFGKLITIELEWLGKLKSFCSYKNCEFKFPSLEVLIVRGCRIMQRFTEGGARAPKLQNIVTANEEGKEEAKWQWKGDLNATIQKGFNKLTPNIEHLTLGEHELNMILSGEFQGNHLNELKVLALFFHFESDVFLQRVPNIEKLEVCDGSFKETFCFDSLNVDEAGLVSQLKVICSDSLPELVSIGVFLQSDIFESKKLQESAIFVHILNSKKFGSTQNNGDKLV